MGEGRGEGSPPSPLPSTSSAFSSRLPRASGGGVAQRRRGSFLSYRCRVPGATACRLRKPCLLRSGCHGDAVFGFSMIFSSSKSEYPDYTQCLHRVEARSRAELFARRFSNDLPAIFVQHCAGMIRCYLVNHDTVFTKYFNNGTHTTNRLFRTRMEPRNRSLITDIFQASRGL